VERVEETTTQETGQKAQTQTANKVKKLLTFVSICEIIHIETIKKGK
jgi:hypothetical protein